MGQPREAEAAPLPGTEALVAWAGEPGHQTDVALVYLHGFSASRQEIAPVIERVAEARGANVFFTRLTGHGLDGAGLAAASLDDWLTDSRRALEIGARLGRRWCWLALPPVRPSPHG